MVKAQNLQPLPAVVVNHLFKGKKGRRHADRFLVYTLKVLSKDHLIGFLYTSEEFCIGCPSKSSLQYFLCTFPYLITCF